MANFSPLPLKFSLGSNSAAIYPDWSMLESSGNKSKNLWDRDRDFNKHNGSISYRAQKKMQNVIKWFILQAPIKTIRCRETGQNFKFRVNFITLTLPAGYQFHSDTDIKNRYLNQFLIECKQYTGMKNYIWKAEPQANGAIHFHITTDAFIHWKMIRNTWNRIIEKDGYITDYGRKQKEHHLTGFNPRPLLYKNWPLCKQLKAYREGVKSDWSNPNTTDVHAVHNIKDLPAYLAKYLSKSDTSRRGITGRLWGTNRKLSIIQKLRFDLTGYSIENDVKKFRSEVKKETLDHCELLIFSTKELTNKTSGRLRFYVDSVIRYLRGYKDMTPELLEDIAADRVPLPEKYKSVQLIFKNVPAKPQQIKSMRDIIYDLMFHDI